MWRCVEKLIVPEIAHVTLFRGSGGGLISPFEMGRKSNDTERVQSSCTIRVNLWFGLLDFCSILGPYECRVLTNLGGVRACHILTQRAYSHMSTHATSCIVSVKESNRTSKLILGGLFDQRDLCPPFAEPERRLLGQGTM